MIETAPMGKYTFDSSYRPMVVRVLSVVDGVATLFADGKEWTVPADSVEVIA